MAKYHTISGEIRDDGKDCYAVISDCRARGKARLVIGPLVDAWSLPEIDRRAHNVRYVQTDGFDIVDFRSVERGAPFTVDGLEPVPSRTTLSIWEASKRQADGAAATPEEIEAFSVLRP